LDLILLASNITNAVIHIDAGRKGFATRGKAEEGRISYETGIAQALSAFQEAQITSDPQTIILAEYTFLSQELEFCEETDNDSLSSLTQAIQSFDDAFLALNAVEKPDYRIADDIFPHSGKYRFNGFPNDAFHIAFNRHKTRLQNILRSPGIDLIEKALLKQRFANLSAGHIGYVAKQKKALARILT
jgi:hypothetical protein